ncbi:hypothetical protein GFC29_1436 [Anoxybacillus sp. B7M1]|jgi:Bacterial domain of unknown function (DUF1798)|uniref:YppE family protein n=1 Tax=Anoxybacteroides rupiense TaxID=311460 RepID=A0ABD5IW99_9BACL|nr:MULTISPECIES: YppE family protein [Anoxybacillus]ANB56391.1 hypothetical protein GFC28_189 [Anoxybacillus sp. B2M1]ANB64027.1 hypothetical protein GFC29_1436 [Anoxybacillus sp. B7M1]KXG10997.1 hypothetical protein AT864_00080 [Anoxybacillus sp. P3H1B]MBB3906574.1 hypothetical protein [Anoxybacillus rupiensis]MBS2770302.1 YppE family protein [Anoxybacillus rupiensis]
MYEQLRRLTNELLKYNDEILQIAEKAVNSHEQPDFFQQVKPFADAVSQTVEKWRQEALAWIRTERPQHVHSQQIEATSENIEKIVVEAFYPAVKLRRLKQFHQSIDYTLTLVSERLEMRSNQ